MKYYAEACNAAGKVFDTGTFNQLFQIRVWACQRHANIVNVYLNNADGSLTRLQVWKYAC